MNELKKLPNKSEFNGKAQGWAAMNFFSHLLTKSVINSLRICLLNRMRFLMILLLANGDECKCKLSKRRKNKKKCKEKHDLNGSNSCCNSKILSKMEWVKTQEFLLNYLDLVKIT